MVSPPTSRGDHEGAMLSDGRLPSTVVTPSDFVLMDPRMNNGRFETMERPAGRTALRKFEPLMSLTALIRALIRLADAVS